ncbi:Hypothetical predicted protein [Mytilus galloprovincialis]|uniref:Uncharacterized protein n=1 Tax=Mytilus galloprovincialis TaxID=29158 RepID=A0A8B6CN67_MYTGA|nr:Hypothetical predicted protein [Mytilus galloprovincialis]
MFDIYLVYRCMNEKLSNHTFCVGMDIAVREHGNEAGFKVFKMGFGEAGKGDRFPSQEKRIGK